MLTHTITILLLYESKIQRNLEVLRATLAASPKLINTKQANKQTVINV